MTNPTQNAALTNHADLFREEAARARRYAEALGDKSVIERLLAIAEIYDELAVGQDPGPTDRE